MPPPDEEEKVYPKGVVAKALMNMAFQDDGLIQYNAEVMLRIFEEKVMPMIGEQAEGSGLARTAVARVRHAGFSTTLPSCQTTSGSFRARFWAWTFLAARRRARSARSTKGGVLFDFRACAFVFMGKSLFSSHQYHGRTRWRTVWREGCGCPTPASARKPATVRPPLTGLVSFSTPPPTQGDQAMDHNTAQELAVFTPVRMHLNVQNPDPGGSASVHPLHH